MKIRLASNITTDSIVDGKGLRVVVWSQGCIHGCKECHTPDTWDPNGGFEKDVDELVKEILDVDMFSGVTFSGGDPLFQPESFSEVAKKLKQKNINIWCYTGYVWEDIIKNPQILKLLNYIDVLVDGPFEIDLKTYGLSFRGSSNQRLIDVKKSLDENKVILFDEA
jgi:anaerobic ribonucleoside-triphosphate reductase activating protein